MSAEIKAVLFGDEGVGKTQVLYRLTGLPFVEKHDSTIGAAFKAKSFVDEQSQNIHKAGIYDTAGQERFRSLLPMYFRGAHLGIYCIDLSKDVDLCKIIADIELFRSIAGENTPIILVGTKKDLCLEQGKDPEQLLEQIDVGLNYFSARVAIAANDSNDPGIDKLDQHIATVAKEHQEVSPVLQWIAPNPFQQPKPQSNTFFNNHWKGILATTLAVASVFAMVGAGLGIGMSITSTIPTLGLSLLLTPVAIPILAAVGFGVGALVGFVAAVIGYAWADKKDVGNGNGLHFYHQVPSYLDDSYEVVKPHSCFSFFTSPSAKKGASLGDNDFSSQAKGLGYGSDSE